MKLFDLKGRVAIVTGGNGGIGLGIARGLAQAGASIAVAGRNAAKNAAAVKALEALGAKAAALEVDVRDEASCRALVARTAEAFGRVDILVNNAGTNIRKLPQEQTLADWREVLDTNLTSAFLCSQAAYPAMVKAGGGKIISIGSMLSIFGGPLMAAYGSSKGGIVQLTRSLAAAWGKDNIQANAILPGFINTDLTKTAKVQIPGLNERVIARAAAGTLGRAGGLRRDRGVPGERGLRLRHRHGNSGRRRLLDPDVTVPAAITRALVGTSFGQIHCREAGAGPAIVLLHVNQQSSARLSRDDRGARAAHARDRDRLPEPRRVRPRRGAADDRRLRALRRRGDGRARGRQVRRARRSRSARSSRRARRRRIPSASSGSCSSTARSSSIRSSRSDELIAPVPRAPASGRRRPGSR